LRQATITFRLARRYLPSRWASPRIGRYQIILLGDRGTAAHVCKQLADRVALGSAATGIRTRDLLIASPVMKVEYIIL